MATYKTPDVYVEEIPVFPPSVTWKIPWVVRRSLRGLWSTPWRTRSEARMLL